MTRRLYLLALLLLPGAASAQALAAFDLGNQHPLIQLYSLPNPGAGALPAPGQWSWRTDARLSNHSIARENAAGERVVLDGESYRTHLVLSYGLRPDLALSATIPLVAHSTGMLDGFIIDWHDFWGLSNERRNEFEKNRLDFSYLQDGTALLSLQERQRGLGDVRLDWEWKLRPDRPGRRALAVRGGLKLPTGAADQLLGSGSTDLSLQLLVTDRRTLQRWGAALSWSVGAVWLGEADVLETLREDLVLLGSAGLRWPLGARFGLRAQLDLHSSFYDSGVAALGKGSVQLSTGFDLRVGDGHWIELAMMQNLRTDTTPDFGLYLSWRVAP